MDIRRILIANRGEIAVRVIRACRELGIDPVAAYEPDDRGALHVALAAEAREVDSYLDADALVAAGEDCDAVHPGYGYLAENADFAEAVARAGLRWIGPPPSAMRALGDKIEARRLAEAAGVPVMPGYAGVLLDDDTLLAEGLRLGSPLIVKAAAGGGGRGMREVDDAPDLPAAIAAARREATAAFGDDRVFLERRLAAARHVEVQILCDSHGRAVHLGERDCSIQRRHQKIVEESPSPAVDGELRSQLGEAALAVAAAAGYEGAGTVEFLLDADGGWWFLELNARLQVEHPVTEAVCGIDLVRAQIEVAAGLPLELEQADVVPRGHAIECRLYAEDPAAGFLPATGTLHRFRLPTWPGVRCDSGVREGDIVGTRYDPLLAKLIAHASDRDACVEKLAAALADTVVLGVTTNLGFLRWALGHRRFRSGEATTAFVAEEWSPELVPPLPEGAAAAGDDIWHQLADDRAGDDPELIVEGEHALYRGWAHRLAADDQEPVAIAAAAGSLSAPMPGTVLEVLVSPGDVVSAGQVLVLLEAMKMELAVHAPADGTVSAVHVSGGELVRAGQPLAEVE
jgi:acetyl/propionyl-CoA carboxylase alpha subunit